MIEIKINGRNIEAREGDTIMQAAGSAGIEIPSMCRMEGYEPFTSCMVCVVEIAGSDPLVPSCSAGVARGMDVYTDSERVKAARKAAVELLLSEHAGDCTAPCQRACPLHIDIPRMIRRIRNSDLAGAAEMLAGKPGCRDSGCSMQCEKVCRRRQADDAVSIKMLVDLVITAAVPQKGGNGAKDHSSRFDSKLKKITGKELGSFLKSAGAGGRYEAAREEGYSVKEAVKESRRCLHCDCGKQDACMLRDAADITGARQSEYSGKRLEFTRHVFNDYVYEPGKCIKCGRCVSICRDRELKYGFGFTGRGFDTAPAVPFGKYENSDLVRIIDIITGSCPTGALVLRSPGEDE